MVKVIETNGPRQGSAGATRRTLLLALSVSGTAASTLRAGDGLAICTAVSVGPLPIATPNPLDILGRKLDAWFDDTDPSTMYVDAGIRIVPDGTTAQHTVVRPSPRTSR